MKATYSPIFFGLALVGPWSIRTSKAQQYQVIDLGALASGVSTPQNLSNTGVVVGMSLNDALVQVPFMWHSSTGMVPLQAGCGNAWAVNNKGHAVGDTCSVAVRWTDVPTVLGTLPGGTRSNALGVNDAGHIVGLSQIGSSSGPEHAFFWTEETGMIDLGTLGPFSAFSRADDINSRDHVCGSAGPGQYAFFWTSETGMQSLGTLGGSHSIATAMNDKDEIVGQSMRADGEEHAFYWSPKEGLIDLGTLGGPLSVALDINNDGWIVGYSWADEIGNAQGAFLSRNGQMVDLNDLIPSDSVCELMFSATGINDAGQIIGNCVIGGNTHAVLLHPIVAVPAVSDWGIVIMGVIGTFLGIRLFRAKRV